MKTTVNLIYNTGFKWFSDQGFYVKGYLYTKDGEFLSGDHLLNYFIANFFNDKLFSSQLQNLNGVFSLIITHKNLCYLCCDKTRYFPVFYKISNEQLTVSDDPGLLRSENDQPDYLSEEEFRRTGYVTGNRTLLQNIHQVKAGELLTIENSTVSERSIFSFRIKKEELKLYGDPITELKEKIDNSFIRLKRSLAGKNPVVPLSGGFDSRLIACKLKDAGFNNTICFTYGRNNQEVQLSKIVAEKLGFKWYFIDYEKIIKHRDLLQEKEFLKYYKYAARYTSMFYLQEFPAVEYLKENDLIPDNAVFIPGHSGDLLGGSQFSKVFKPTIRANEVAKEVLSSKYFMYPSDRTIKYMLLDLIERQLGDTENYIGYSIFEDWDIKEKIAKFIFNSAQVFTYFGYEVRFPYWDNELVEFFRTLPPEYRTGKKLYDDCLKICYFEKHDVNMTAELSVNQFKIKTQEVKEYIKKLLPLSVKHKLIRRNDWQCYYEMSLPMRNELNQKTRKLLPWKNLNSILINWYLTRISQKKQK